MPPTAPSMTLVDIKNYIFSHLMTESTFSLADDVASVKLPKDERTQIVETHKVALFKTALMDLVRMGVVVEVDGVPGLYVLTQPLQSYTQTITLPPIVAEMVGDLVDGFSDALDDEDPYVVNRMAVTGEDIGRLCHICHMLLDEGGSRGGSDAQQRSPA